VTQRYAFVVGTGRCGSTLVHELLARHEQVGFVTNLDDRFGVRSRRTQVEAYRRLPDRLTEKGRARFAPSEGYRALEREVSPLFADSFRDLQARDVTPWLASRFREFFTARAQRQQLPLFLHKFTGWPRVGFVSAVMPEAKFIHIVRDGRAVANSWLQMPWWRGQLGPESWHFGPLPAHLAKEWEDSERSFVVLAGLAWRLLVDAFDEAARPVPPGQWLELRYEDVLADPATAFRRMTDFLGLPWTPQYAGVITRTRFSATRSDAYIRDLGAVHTAALERAMSGALQRHGYLPSAASNA
jgi:omega-hydroxy-beta-dihydromenaquinone-9 sulfotransferase